MGLTCVPRKCRLRVESHSSHVSPRSYAKRERPSASAVPSKVRKPTTASVARRANTASSRVVPPPERQATLYHASACHAKAGCVLEATARTSHHGLAPKERGVPPAQCPSRVRKSITASAARRARAASSRVVRLLRDSQRSGACSRATRNPAMRWRSQLARRTTILRPKREAFRRCSIL